MKIYILILIPILVSCSSEQTEKIELDKIKNEDSIKFVQNCGTNELFVVKKEEGFFDAQFPGGDDSLQKFIDANRKVKPESNGLVVDVGFNVKMNGKIEGIQIQKETGCSSCETESMKIVSKMPLWTPAYITDSIGKRKHFEQFRIVSIEW